MRSELSRERTQFIVERPERFEFSCGCKAFTDSYDPNFVWLCSPYGIESAISLVDGSELRKRLQRYLNFWSADRRENGDLIE